MTTTVVTTDGTYTGRTLLSVIRRVFGRSAYLRHEQESGHDLIVRRVGEDQTLVLGKVLRWEGVSGYEREDDDYRADELPADDWDGAPVDRVIPDHLWRESC